MFIKPNTIISQTVLIGPERALGPSSFIFFNALYDKYNNILSQKWWPIVSIVGLCEIRSCTKLK